MIAACFFDISDAAACNGLLRRNLSSLCEKGGNGGDTAKMGAGEETPTSLQTNSLLPWEATRRLA
jgi:hypothetical protein